MSTATMDPPLRAVFTPTDAVDAAEVLDQQKSRWAVFLIARDAVLEVAQGVRSQALRLVEKLGLSSALAMAGRCLGWLVGVLNRARQVLRAPGLRPGLLWGLTTTFGQKVAGAVANHIGKTVGTSIRWTYATVLNGLRRLGWPGQAVATKLESLALRTRRATTKLRPLVQAARLVLSPSGLASHLVSGWARFKVLSVLVVKHLPRPWNLLGLLLAVVVAVPSRLRGHAFRLVGDLTQSSDDDRPTPPPAAVRLVPPPSASTDEPDVPVLVQPEPVAVNDEPTSEAARKALQKYPANKRSSNAKKRR